MDRNETISVLNGLITTAKDGQEGFQEAAENTKDSNLRQYFSAASLERARFAADLQQEVRSLGGDPEDSSSVAGSLHRTWIEIKGTLTGRDEHAILAECERGEDSAVKAYREALRGELPANIRETVERQLAEILKVHGEVKQYRDSYARV